VDGCRRLPFLQGKEGSVSFSSPCSPPLLFQRRETGDREEEEKRKRTTSSSALKAVLLFTWRIDRQVLPRPQYYSEEGKRNRPATRELD
jgi:hypothetical protein